MYDDAGSFTAGMALVAFNDKWGLIDKSGREILPCCFEGIKFSSKIIAVRLEA